MPRAGQELPAQHDAGGVVTPIDFRPAGLHAGPAAVGLRQREAVMANASGTPWVDGLTIGQVLAETARQHPDREALVFPQLGRRWTWRQFAADVDAAARGVIALGIRTGGPGALGAAD